MQKSSIEWTDYTSNPIRAIHNGKLGWFCTHIAPGCTNCYAETINKRFGTKLDFTKQNEPKITALLIVKELQSWKKIPDHSKVFICDMSDLFHELIPENFIFDVFRHMASNPKLIFQVLTKRPQRMATLVPQIRGHLPDRLNHVWLGCSVSDQKTADENIPHLLQTPATVHFLSCEPLLGPINLTGNPELEAWPWAEAIAQGQGIDWVIVGGESGSGARPCNVEWIRSAIRQCKVADVKCFVKQLGAKPVMPEMSADCDPCMAGMDRAAEFYVPMKLNDSKGGDPGEWPLDLRVREFPSIGRISKE